MFFPPPVLKFRYVSIAIFEVIKYNFAELKVVQLQFFCCNLEISVISQLKLLNLPLFSAANFIRVKFFYCKDLKRHHDNDTIF